MPVTLCLAPVSELRVTFLIPTWNRATKLRRAIDSVLTQPSASLEAVELIVVDDGSTDATPAAMLVYESDKRVKYIRLPENRGVAAARNVGIDAATGSWIVLLDSDNAMLPAMLPRLLGELSALREDVGIFWANSRDSSGTLTVRDTVRGVVPGVHLVEGRYPGEHFSAVRAALARRHRFAELGTRNECAACFWFPIALASMLYKTPEPYQQYETTGEDRVTSYSSRRHRAGELVRCFEETVHRYGNLLLAHAPKSYWGLQGRIAFYRSVGGEWFGAAKAGWRAAAGARIVPSNLVVFALCALGPWATRSALRRL
jgi:glycosyltransferase involved in cell wall biosynthesis